MQREINHGASAPWTSARSGCAGDIRGLWSICPGGCGGPIVEAKSPFVAAPRRGTSRLGVEVAAGRDAERLAEAGDESARSLVAQPVRYVADRGAERQPLDRLHK